jgi:hypothetical protein
MQGQLVPLLVRVRNTNKSEKPVGVGGRKRKGSKAEAQNEQFFWTPYQNTELIRNKNNMKDISGITETRPFTGIIVSIARNREKFQLRQSAHAEHQLCKLVCTGDN